MPDLTTATPAKVLAMFLTLRLIQYAIETWLSRSNKNWWSDTARQADARDKLGISLAEMESTVQYTSDKYYFGRAYAVTQIVALFAFLSYGGLGLCENAAVASAGLINGGSVVTGLLFIGILTLASQALSLPFSIYSTFVIEQKHGYNKQSPKGFVADLAKGLTLAVILGAAILSLILWIMERAGTVWWIYAWAATTVVSLMVAWIYPTLLAPLFNKFTPLEDGPLKSSILRLAEQVGFKSDGIFVMDASKRSGHGNAYFTGMFGKKRIVLFDTLINSMSPDEVVAVLAHELGHFKLHHVRYAMIRGILLSMLTFAGIGYMLPNEVFYHAFGLSGVTNYGGLVVFSLWFGLLDFYIQPAQTLISRKNEFAADAFAIVVTGTGKVLASALKKLREKSNVMPIAHPAYSGMYYSHPPMLERIAKLLKHDNA
jgi:STE24 endopeptidase